MDFLIAVKKTITKGTKVIIEVPALNENKKNHVTSFEDDGTTGYFFAIDINDKDMEMQDAVHIYDINDVSDKGRTFELKILWSDDGNLSMLEIDNYIHALFDFKNKQGYCRNDTITNIKNKWSKKGHTWDSNKITKILKQFL